MKRPEYVAAVTDVYRKALDTGNVSKPMMDALLTAFNRQGFTQGYYTGNLGKGMFGIREEKTEDPTWLRLARQSYEAVENQLVDVKFHAVVCPEYSSLTVTDPEGRTCTVSGPVPQEARTQLLTHEDLAARLAKTGGTPYHCGVVTSQITPGLTLSAAAINALRRDCLNQLTAIRGRRDTAMLLRMRKMPHFTGNRERPDFTVSVTTREQITAKLLKLNPAVLYVPLHILAADPDFTRQLAKRVPVAATLPRIVHDGEMNAIRDALRIVRAQGVRAAGGVGVEIVLHER